MATIAIAMVRDEADIIRPVVEHMLSQVDDVIVADNGSTDGTRDILEGLSVHVIDDPERAYYQSIKMTRLAHEAAALGADWVLPFDADEIWYSPFGRIADVLADLAPQWLAAEATMYDHVPTGADPAEDDPVRRIRWRRKAAGALPKVACRSRSDLEIAQGNHSAIYNGGTTSMPGQLVIRHFPYRSAEQFVRKARNGAEAYAAAVGLSADAGLHWRRYGDILRAHGEEALADVFRQWVWVRFPELDESLMLDPVP